MVSFSLAEILRQNVMKTAQKLIYLNTNVKSSNTLKGMLVQKEVKLILVCETLVKTTKQFGLWKKFVLDLGVN